MTTVKSVQMMTKRKLLAIKGLSEAKVEKILSVAKKLDGKTCTCTAVVIVHLAMGPTGSVHGDAG